MQLFSYLENQARVIDRNDADISTLAKNTRESNDNLEQKLRVTISYQ